MASENLDVGTTANDGTGDALRDAFIKIRKMFAELYGQTYSSDTQDLSGTAFAITAADVGLGTTDHAQFHCLGIGEAASTVNGQIDATNVYADNIGKDSTDYIAWTDNTQLDFYVNGSNEMRLESDGDLHVDGDVIAASTTVASDEKLKDNITKYENALDTINAIKGVSFDWKRNGKKSGGVIAQDVQKVLPELVKEVKDLDGDDTHLTVDYNAIIGVLVEAVKELSEQVNKK
jgi:hypothetical protein